MRRQHVGLAVRRLLPDERGPQGRRTPERGQEARGAVGVEPRPRDDADADPVGLELLLAGEAGERLLFRGLDLLPLLPALDDAGRLAHHRRLLLAFGAGVGVTRGDVADLVRHDRGDLGIVVGERQKPARHE